MTNKLVLRNVRLRDGRIIDISMVNDHIEAIGENLACGAEYVQEHGDNALVLPGFVEGHTHLDKTNWGRPWYHNDVGAKLTDRIENERRWRAESGHHAGRQSLALARAFLALGTTRLRTHVDIDTEAGLGHLHHVLETRETMRPAMQIQIVAFPQSGMLCRPGTVGLLEQALDQGADVLGALDPTVIDRDPVASLDATFALAGRYQKPVDIHLHESGDVGARTFGLILDRVEALGMQGNVVVSHAFCLGELPEEQRHKLLFRIAAAKVALLTTAPASMPVPPWRECLEAGITLFAGNDGVRDAWTPHGKPDMLERAMLVGLRYNLRRDADLALAFESVSVEGAKACGFTRYGVEPGSRADFVLLEAENVAHALVERPIRKLVIAGGKIVVRDGKLIAPMSETNT